jgi:transcriptional regulator with XRE-family HTH domain
MGYRLMRLREFRENQFMSVSTLARKTGLSRNTIYLLEADKSEARIETVGKLAHALGVAAADLIGDPSDRQPQAEHNRDLPTSVVLSPAPVAPLAPIRKAPPPPEWKDSDLYATKPASPEVLAAIARSVQDMREGKRKPVDGTQRAVADLTNPLQPQGGP